MHHIEDASVPLILQRPTVYIRYILEMSSMKFTKTFFIRSIHIFLVFRKSKDLYLIITQKLIIHEIRRISPWNPADFMQISREIWQISCGFHEILGHSPHPAFIKLKSFCWNTCFCNFGWISQVKSGWNPQISWVKSTGFQGEIWWISWNPWS